MSNLPQILAMPRRTEKAGLARAWLAAVTIGLKRQITENMQESKAYWPRRAIPGHVYASLTMTQSFGFSPAECRACEVEPDHGEVSLIHSLNRK
ncbi:MAG: hypothetical protein WAT78_00510 [Rhizobiaceae bacterium]